MTTTKQEIGTIVSLLVALGVLLALIPAQESEPAWCTPDKAGVAALEAEVHQYVLNTSLQDLSAPLIDASGVRAGLLAECG